MNDKIKFTRQTINLSIYRSGEYVPEPIDAWVANEYAIHVSPVSGKKPYHVTHVPSGAHLISLGGNKKLLRDAKQLVIELIETGVTLKANDSICTNTPEEQSKIAKVLRSWRFVA